LLGGFSDNYYLRLFRPPRKSFLISAKLEIVNFRFHDLRHTAASWLRMQGADIHTVARLLGHKDLRMAARYQHLSPAFLAEAVNRLDAVFGDLSHHSVTTPKALPASIAVSV
jgi:integrase